MNVGEGGSDGLGREEELCIISVTVLSGRIYGTVFEGASNCFINKQKCFS